MGSISTAGKRTMISTPHEKLLGISRVSNPFTSIDPGSLKIGFLVLIQNAGCVRDNGTKYPKEGYRGRNPVSKKLLGWPRVRLLHKWSSSASSAVAYARGKRFVYMYMYVLIARQQRRGFMIQ